MLAAVYQFGSGLTIYAKANLAQYLIKQAWAESLTNSKAVKPWSWADTWPVAKLTLAGKELFVLEGASGRVLAFGPGHMSQTVLPGEAGNAVIVGHRDTHFGLLKELNNGDVIKVQTPNGSSNFRIISLRIADQSQTNVLNNSKQNLLTLITCYPFNSLTPNPHLRYVVRAIKV